MRVEAKAWGGEDSGITESGCGMFRITAETEEEAKIATDLLVMLMNELNDIGSIKVMKQTMVDGTVKVMEGSERSK